ncbi:hypothetical protein ACVIGB_001080 [Bradyrhizobium sp. USDA 4341]
MLCRRCELVNDPGAGRLRNPKTAEDVDVPGAPLIGNHGASLLITEGRLMATLIGNQLVIVRKAVHPCHGILACWQRDLDAGLGQKGAQALVDTLGAREIFNVEMLHNLASGGLIRTTQAGFNGKAQ